MNSKMTNASLLLVAATLVLAACFHATHFALGQEVSADPSDPDFAASPADPGVPQLRQEPNETRGLNMLKGPVADTVRQTDSMAGDGSYLANQLLFGSLNWDRKRLNDVVRINTAILKSDLSDEQKGEARKNIRYAMNNFFQQDIEHREKEIEAVEARVKKLREQLDKRREAKDEIIDLQLKLIEMEAAGLGLVPQAKAGRSFAGEVLSNQITADPNFDLLEIPFGESANAAESSAGQPDAAPNRPRNDTSSQRNTPGK